MTTIVLAVLLLGQAEVPFNMRGDLIRMDEVPVGQRVRVYSQALVMDERGQAWLRKDWLANTVPDRWDSSRELEVINNKLGWIVRVHPTWKSINGYKVPQYPTWKKSAVSEYTHFPVKGLVVVPPPRPRVERPRYVRVGVASGPVFPPPYWRPYAPSLRPPSPGLQSQSNGTRPRHAETNSGSP